jgi:hypothetical protein
MNRYKQADEVRCSEHLWSCQEVVFESFFYVTKLSGMTMVRNFEVMSGQTLNHSV